MKKILVYIMVLISLFSMAYSVVDLLPLQGTVYNSSGSAIALGNIQVLIYDAAASGNLIYNSSSDFNNKIINGQYDILLGSGTVDLTLEYGKIYYMDILINGDDIDFNGNERQMFQSSVGEIRRTSSTAISNGTNSFASGISDFYLKGTKFQVLESSGGGGSAGCLSSGGCVHRTHSLNNWTLETTSYPNMIFGDGSSAFGASNSVFSNVSSAFGFFNSVSGESSFAFGVSNSAKGLISFAFGYNAHSYGQTSFAFGEYIYVYGNNSYGFSLDSNYYELKQSNTMAIMGGNVGIGTTTPQATVDIDGDLKISNNNSIKTEILINRSSDDQKGSILELSKNRNGNSILNYDNIGQIIFSFTGSDSNKITGALITSDIQNYSGNYDANLNFLVSQNDTQIKMLTINRNGVGFGLSSPTPQRTVHINDAMRLEPILGSQPSTPALGDLYVDGDTNELCFYNSTAWVGITGNTCD